MKKIILTFALVLGMAPLARAGFMVEPHLGYESSTSELITAAGTDSGGTSTGTTLGARLGYKFPLMLWVAADVDYTTGQIAYTAAGSSPASDTMTRTVTYLDVGIDLPILFRAWLGYGISGSSVVAVSGGDRTITGKSAMKAGIGFKMIPFLSINVEYLTRVAKEMEQNGTTFDMDTIFPGANKDTGFIVSVSAPFNF